jgi:hypothetical protein
MATKRITAVAASAALVSSAVFANLSVYPTNFVDNAEFEGTVVIGSMADSAAATSIIADLTAELSGDSEQVKITAKMTSTTGGDIVSALDDKTTLNYGADSTAGFEIEELDEDSTDLLADNDLDAENYEQTLSFVDTGAEFGYRLFDEVDANSATDGLYFDNGAEFATYTLTFTDALGLTATSSDAANQEYIGETLTIMGNEFTVLEISTTKLTLVGGANKVSLGEGDVSTVSVDGVSYEVSVQSVSDDKILLSINGESKSVDFNEVEDIAGITVGITEIVESDRDAVKGYATIVVGGQKIEFGGSEVQINDEDFTDIYEDYELNAVWTGTPSSESLTITYKIDDEILLSEGDSLSDSLFGAFTLSYDGVNNVDYSELAITSDKDSIDFAGNLYNGDAIPSEFQITADETVITADADVFTLGADDERIFFSGSVVNTAVAETLDGTVVTALNTNFAAAVAATDASTVAGDLLATADVAGVAANGYTVTLTQNDGLDAVPSITSETATDIVIEFDGDSNTATWTDIVTELNLAGTFTATLTSPTNGADNVVGADGQVMTLAGGAAAVDATTLTFDLSDAALDIDGQLFFTQETAKEDMHLYQVTSSNDDGVDSEISFDDLISTSDYNDRGADDLESDLESNTFTDGAQTVTVVLADLSEDTVENRNGRTGTDSTLYLENEMLLNFEAAESADSITLSYSSDADADDETILNDDIVISFSQVIDGANVDDTEAIKLQLGGGVVTGMEFADDSDFDLYVDSYGTMVKFDTEDFNSVTIMVPDKEVFGTISFNFGDAGSKVDTYTVDAAMADAKVAELESDGYTVTTESVSTEAVAFDITAPVMADEVSGMDDMIVVGGPAVNAVAVSLLGEGVVGVTDGEAVIRYFAESNSVLVYGYDAAGTQAAANKLNAGGLTGEEVNVQ